MGLGTARSAQSRLFRGVSFTNPFTNVGPLVCQCRAVLRVRRGAQSGAERTARAQGCCNDSCNIPTLVGEESGSGDAFEPTTRHRDADVLAVPANSDAARNYLDSARPHRWLGPQAPPRLVGPHCCITRVVGSRVTGQSSHDESPRGRVATVW